MGGRDSHAINLSKLYDIAYVHALRIVRTAREYARERVMTYDEALNIIIKQENLNAIDDNS